MFGGSALLIFVDAMIAPKQDREQDRGAHSEEHGNRCFADTLSTFLALERDEKDSKGLTAVEMICVIHGRPLLSLD